MDISIRGQGEANSEEKVGFEDSGEWDEKKDEQESKEEEVQDIQVCSNVEEVLLDPVDVIMVERCCPQVCYNVCPCCIGDPDSPFWQLWYKHRLQMSR